MTGNWTSTIVRFVTKFLCLKCRNKDYFPLDDLFARTHKKVGTLPSCSRRTFSPANFNQSRCRILIFASRRANKVAKWKIGVNQESILRK